MRVLSLFDGISTGFVVLQKLRLKVDKYFSSEIDENALRGQRFHFHNQVIPVGCVTRLQDHEINEMGRIDLLIGGSPCQDLSLANPRRRGLHGECLYYEIKVYMCKCSFSDPTLPPQGDNSTGKLFFEYVRILKQLQMNAKKYGFNLFWLFENTAAMEVHTRQEISEYVLIALGALSVSYCYASLFTFQVPWLRSIKDLLICICANETTSILLGQYSYNEQVA